jgi:glycosyltransferase involved in cell wall biosynthesis
MQKQIKIVVTVISDLVTDQRVHKVCTSLQNNGYKIVLIGARRKNSLPLTARAYTAKRIHLFFQRKVWFYAEFNTRLFLKLLFTRFDIVLGNDLDVMPASYLAARLKGKPIVYDTHEYYLGMPELNGKPAIKKVWSKIEQAIFARVKYIYTICKSFCDLYYKDYGKQLWFIQNVPFLYFTETGKFEEEKRAIEKQIPKGKKILLFQGAGINVERGVEELVASMNFLDPAHYHLLIVGGGDIFDTIKELVNKNRLTDRITIIPKVPFEVLRHITKQAHIGFTLDKPTNINHIYGLPNKIFDYAHAGIPIISSRLVELESIIRDYGIGTFIENHNPKHIAECIKNAFEHPELLEEWKKNTEKVKMAYNWENEEVKLVQIFDLVSKEAHLQ